MHTQDNSHAIKQLLDDLNEDQLLALDLMLINASSPTANGYFHGLISMMLQIKFDVCACGEKHNPEDEFPDVPVSKPPTVPNEATEHKGKSIEDVDLPLAVGSTEWHAKLEEYNIVVIYQSHDSGAYELRCDGCNKAYPSIEDRMLRPPGIEGCEGCQQKSAWG